MVSTPDPATMPAYQLERRRTILKAARAMLEEQDFDQVQVRDIAARAGVAVGTLYRYFSSKEHLYAVVLGEWGRPVGDLDWLSALAPADRFRARMHQSFAALGRNPNYFKIVQMLSTTADPSALNESAAFEGVLTAALMSDLGALDETEARHLTRIVWAMHGDLLGQVVQGRLTLPECLAIVDTFADLVKMRLEAVAS